MGGGGKSVGIQELSRLIRIGDISCDSPEGSVVVRPARPDLEVK